MDDIFVDQTLLVVELEETGDSSFAFVVSSSDEIASNPRKSSEDVVVSGSLAVLVVALGRLDMFVVAPESSAGSDCDHDSPVGLVVAPGILAGLVAVPGSLVGLPVASESSTGLLVAHLRVEDVVARCSSAGLVAAVGESAGSLVDSGSLAGLVLAHGSSSGLVDVPGSLTGFVVDPGNSAERGFDLDSLSEHAVEFVGFPVVVFGSLTEIAHQDLDEHVDETYSSFVVVGDHLTGFDWRWIL